MCAVALIYMGGVGDSPEQYLYRRHMYDIFRRRPLNNKNILGVDGGMCPRCACTCAKFSWLKVLLTESLDQDHSAVNTRISVTAAPSKTSRSVKKKDLVQGCAQCVRNSVLFNRHLTIASIWRRRSNKQKKRLITAKRSPPAVQHLCKLPRNSWLLSVWRPHVHTCTRSKRRVTLTCSAQGCLS